jgi:hypothetical protein
MWIKCSDAMPRKMWKVLVFHARYMLPMVAHLELVQEDGNNSYPMWVPYWGMSGDLILTNNVTHWQPLMEPPKELMNGAL